MNTLSLYNHNNDDLDCTSQRVNHPLEEICSQKVFTPWNLIESASQHMMQILPEKILNALEMTPSQNNSTLPSDSVEQGLGHKRDFKAYLLNYKVQMRQIFNYEKEPSNDYDLEYVEQQDKLYADLPKKRMTKEQNFTTPNLVQNRYEQIQPQMDNYKTVPTNRKDLLENDQPYQPEATKQATKKAFVEDEDEMEEEQATQQADFGQDDEEIHLEQEEEAKVDTENDQQLPLVKSTQKRQRKEKTVKPVFKTEKKAAKTKRGDNQIWKEMKNDQKTYNKYKFFRRRTVYRDEGTAFLDDFKDWCSGESIRFELKDIKDLEEMLGHIKGYCKDRVIRNMWDLFDEYEQKAFAMCLIVVVYGDRASNDNEKIDECRNGFISEAMEEMIDM